MIKQKIYSAPDMAKLLGVSRQYVQTLMDVPRFHFSPNLIDGTGRPYFTEGLALRLKAIYEKRKGKKGLTFRISPDIPKRPDPPESPLPPTT